MGKLLEVKSLSVTYDDGKTKAVNNFTMDLGHKEIIAIVGESGCGKSTLIKSIFNLLPPNGKIVSGEILFNKKNLHEYSQEQWRTVRGNQMSMIFQNPGSYLNPILKIGKQFVESIRAHQRISKNEALILAKETLRKMQFTDTERILNSYPFQLSGGMKQRVAIGMALIMEPKLILADEPTSALDVVTQVEIMNELLEFKEHANASILWITHNIGSAAYIADRIIVMNNGEMVEFDQKRSILTQPKMEYTQKLLQSIPTLKGFRNEQSNHSRIKSCLKGV
ncbi:ABC transporter ATP-binding protein [Bacillus sp. B15-48]|uniref:ABC transporter ATP-binding protein n=1 Tax=Bacillus sp. B15-48 TaxID=1548601 RepID=UPI00193F0E42|nr:ABC transporter ATP-binding protein [Bacillus sp. B15-48]MBM4763014.1 ATP-binding cassette domain-containing protein [Bacillus sp. B15-48]